MAGLQPGGRETIIPNNISLQFGDNNVLPVTIEIVLKAFSYKYTSIPTAIVSSTTQLFFTWRIWRYTSTSLLRFPLETSRILLVPASLYTFHRDFSDVDFLAGIIAFTIICQNPGSSISSQAVTVRFKSYAISYINTPQKLLESIWAVGAIVDILISASLLSILWIRRRDTFKSTTQILHRLSIVIVNTGLWTSVVTLLTLVGVWQRFVLVSFR
ncbi:hypothetical protein IW262DRAFT_1290838 [Armillaria fumosa]|nr:hypothetical protein IW262DRAFT_1290838 [Armillaria fumosa]